MGSLLVVIAASIWGSFGLFVRALDYAPETILFYRFLFGLLGSLIFTAIRGDKTWIKPALTHWKWMFLPASFTGLSWLAYTYSLGLTSVANAAFLIYTAPVFTVIFAPLVLKERVELRTFAALLISITGTIAIMGYSSLFSVGSNLWGDLIALCGGLVYGFVPLALKRVPPDLLGIPSNILMSLYITIAMAPFALMAGMRIELKGLLLLMALGFLHQTLAVTLMHLGLREIKAQYASILTYVEPLAATTLAALFLYEGITWGSLLGGVLIITGGLLIVLRRTPSTA
jgi:drug/metabolite transporter (DMT)-like permease